MPDILALGHGPLASSVLLQLYFHGRLGPKTFLARPETAHELGFPCRWGGGQDVGQPTPPIRLAAARVPHSLLGSVLPAARFAPVSRPVAPPQRLRVCQRVEAGS